jgi:hypothetical protein
MSNSIAVATEIPIDHVFEAKFDAFHSRLTIISETQLQVEIISGMSAGLVEVVEYKSIGLGAGRFALSWQEVSRMTVVHIADFVEHRSHAHATLPDGTFLRFSGQISIPS